jgi:membrane protein implicated in regulation of membrane protease activity
MHAAHPTHTLIAVFTLIAALVFGGLGVMLVWLGSTGNTTFKILGTDVSSENAGIAAIGLAVVLLLLTFRRVILSTERLHNPK